MKNKIILVLMLLIFAGLAFKVNAVVGVTSSYFENNPMYAKAGELVEFAFTLQNSGDGTDATVTAAMAQGEGIAELTDENLVYDVPLGSKGIPVPMVIRVPADALPGDEFTVGASFDVDYEATGEGGVQLGVGYHKDFKVIVEPGVPEVTAEATEEEAKAPLFGTGLTNFVLLLVILVVLFLVIKVTIGKKKR